MQMTVAVSMFRGLNLASHHRIRMEPLRALHEELGLAEPQTLLQSGNVVFRAEANDLDALAARIESGFERRFGFRSAAILRTVAALRDVVARNPFADRKGIEPAKLAVTFLALDPGAELRKKVLTIKTDPEELRIAGREMYIYFPNGMGRSKFPMALIEKTLGTTGTARNWNTVTKLLELASRIEAQQPVSGAVRRTRVS